ncbi:cytochrome c oxidase subunit II [Caldibacillus lycopersici]|uniref:Cytochrome c oxidase subunit 2 n=1 Tax=Perspicuibacillus lycopersici TaxID=1325689 RepID=A0AAE3LLD9_9BACI|nr:cytochrome c oxidase subunit II [Perspicuibacillus lycopersici]MCU9612235.1 cytochrome c oxidase subunit II [Perspicuibacillus lycopersici]
MKKWRLMTLLFLMALVLAGCGKPYLSTLQPAGEVAGKQLDLLIFSSLIMLFVIIVVVIVYVLVLVRFRRKKVGEDFIPKQVEGSHKLEVIWTVIPIILVLILSVPTILYTFEFGNVKGMEKVDQNGDKEALVVNVRANLYWWEFEYPDLGIVTSQDLVVPTDEKVYFNLISSDVKHSFWIPSIGGKMDTNTENTNTFYLEFDQSKADAAGNLFFGKCAELCGPSHAYMDFKVKAVSRDEFNQWATAMQNSTEEPTPTSDVALRGQELFQENNCFSCHATTANDERPAAARTAPNLADFGNRTKVAGILDHTKEDLKNWIQHPGEYKPGNKMYDENDFTEEELDALAEYLMGLKVQE